MKPILTIGLLVISNVFMTFAWYGHLKLKETTWGQNLGLSAIILISWGLAFFEYNFMVPANRIGYAGNGGPFNLFQLRIIQRW
jgi:uncharacterized protein